MEMYVYDRKTIFGPQNFPYKNFFLSLSLSLVEVCFKFDHDTDGNVV